MKPVPVVMLLVLAATVPFDATAAQSPEDYVSSLRTVQEGIQKRRARTASHLLGSLSDTAVAGTPAYSYAVGETWDIAAFHEIPTATRRIDDPAHLNATPGSAGIFRYEVLAV